MRIFNVILFLAFIFVVCTAVLLFVLGKSKDAAASSFVSVEDHGELKIYHSKILSEAPMEFGICLSSFTDLSRIHRFAFHARRWKGPFSIAIFVDSVRDAQIAIAFIVAVQRKEEFRNIQLHLAHSKQYDMVSLLHPWLPDTRPQCAFLKDGV